VVDPGKASIDQSHEQPITGMQWLSYDGNGEMAKWRHLQPKRFDQLHDKDYLRQIETRVEGYQGFQ
jgi:hypothetical protein